MRIMSKFQDYYDCGVAYGIDKKILYKRKTKSFCVDFDSRNPRLESIEFRSVRAKQHPTKNPEDMRNFDYTPVGLSFCGKLYMGLEIVERIDLPPTSTNFHEYVTTYIWNMDDVENHEFIDEVGYYYWYDKPKFTYFNILDDEEMNMKYDSPVVLERYVRSNYEPNVFVNPSLKELGFSRVVDPYQAFQEISMYISGPLAHRETDDLEMSGKQKMQNKGMDEVYGFRKRPKK